MRLSKLSLQGYKTFAAKTEFLFDGNITAIVGPNGSGKSNIADAIRWVLGEQSYMTLRGKRTTDMIFSGGRNRSRAGMAQAILTLDNTDGWLPIDYSEIEIGRRAYRSGENEYILNGQTVRLKDVSELLANSGLAERTYTIIGQGLVDQALSLRPQERRALFEEAAGIGLYKTKRSETVRHLEETRLNLERVNDISAELTPRLRQLKRQANKTRNSDQLASDLHHLLRIWYGYQWQHDQEELTISHATSQVEEEKWRAGRGIILELRKKIEEKRKELRASGRIITDIETQRVKIRDNLGAARQEVAVVIESQSILAGQKNSLTSRLRYLTGALGAAEHKLKQAQAEAEAAGSELEKMRQTLERFQHNQGANEVAILSLESKIGSLDDELKFIDNSLSRADGRSIQIEERIVEITASKTEETELAEAENRCDRSKLELKKLAKSTDKVQANRKRVADKLAEMRIGLDSYRAEIEKLKSRQIDIRELISRVEAKIEVLEQQIPVSGDVPENVSITGRIVDFVSVPSDYQIALTAVLAQVLEGYVVENEKDLWRLVNYSQKEGTDISATLPGAVSERSAPVSHPEVRYRLSDLISVSGELEATLKKLVENVYLVDDGPTALKVIEDFPPGTALVSLDGVVVKSGRLVQYLPHTIDVSRGKNIKELVSLREKAVKHTVRRTQIDNLIDDKMASLEPLQKEFGILEIELAELTEAEKLADFTMAKLQAENDRCQKDFERISHDSARLDLALSKARVLLKSTRTEIGNLSEKREDVAENIISKNDELSNLPVEETKHERRLLQQGLQSAHTIAAGRVAVVDSRESTLEQLRVQLARAEADYKELEAKQDKLNLASLEENAALIEKVYSDSAKRLGPAQQVRVTLRKELETLERKIDKQQTINDNLETSYTQARINNSQQENNVQALKERIRAELGIVTLRADNGTVQTPLPISDLVEVLPDVEHLPEDIESSILRLRGQLNRIGPIYPDAPNEYQELKNRLNFLQGQVADLVATSERLNLIIEELDELTSKSVAETVERVDHEFRKVFKRLFGGGVAQLVLTDPDDLAVSGVDIVARLPGRRDQNLGLLSGGERALTAAALVFSLLKVSPTPFCVLDEVDAMLDEANIRRFRDLLCELSEQTQFVVITHNRGTIQVADNVYGVSMGSDSSSQVISIKPESYIAASTA